MFNASDLLARLPGPVTDRWPMGECFVAAGVPHRFESFSDDFATWVVFWGPRGGEH
jgi:hypothetical protein